MHFDPLHRQSCAGVGLCVWLWPACVHESGRESVSAPYHVGLVGGGGHCCFEGCDSVCVKAWGMKEYSKSRGTAAFACKAGVKRGRHPLSVVFFGGDVEPERLRRPRAPGAARMPHSGAHAPQPTRP